MVTFYLEHIAPQFWFFLALALTMGISFAVGMNVLRKRLSPAGQERLQIFQTSLHVLAIVAMVVAWVGIALMYALR
jgi:TRAP-type C4-dicarboxylate transport system permease small subunit